MTAPIAIALTGGNLEFPRRKATGPPVMWVFGDQGLTKAFDPTEARDAEGKWTAGAATAGAATPESSGARTLDDLAAGGAKELGPQRILAWRVGQVADPYGRGVFFGSSAEAVENYASGHEGYATQAYVVTTKRTAVFKSQYEAYQETFGKPLDIYAMEKRHGFKITSPVAWAMLEAQLMKRLKAKGYDSVIFLAPPLPAQLELAVIARDPAGMVETTGPIATVAPPVVAQPGEPLTWNTDRYGHGKAVTTRGNYTSGPGGSVAFFRAEDDEMEHLGFHGDVAVARQAAEAHHLARGVAKAFNPHEARDPEGKWTAGAGGPAAAGKDAALLKIAQSMGYTPATHGAFDPDRVRRWLANNGLPDPTGQGARPVAPKAPRAPAPGRVAPAPPLPPPPPPPRPARPVAPLTPDQAQRAAVWDRPAIPIPPDLDHDDLLSKNPNEIDPTWEEMPAQTRMAYGGVIISPTGMVLVRRPTGEYGGYAWSFAKGGIDPGEHPLTCAVREVEQETGHAGQVVGTVPGNFERGSGIARYFLMRSVGEDPSKMDNETESMRWVKPSEAARLICQSRPRQAGNDLDVLDRALKAAGHPGIIEEWSDENPILEPEEIQAEVAHAVKAGPTDLYGLLDACIAVAPLDPVEFGLTVDWMANHGHLRYSAAASTFEPVRPQRRLQKAYNPAEARDPHGRWTGGDIDWRGGAARSEGADATGQNWLVRRTGEGRFALSGYAGPHAGEHGDYPTMDAAKAAAAAHVTDAAARAYAAETGAGGQYAGVPFVVTPRDVTLYHATPEDNVADVERLGLRYLPNRTGQATNDYYPVRGVFLATAAEMHQWAAFAEEDYRPEDPLPFHPAHTAFYAVRVPAGTRIYQDMELPGMAGVVTGVVPPTRIRRVGRDELAHAAATDQAGAVLGGFMKAYRATEARRPAGGPGGGQWTDTGGGEAALGASSDGWDHPTATTWERYDSKTGGWAIHRNSKTGRYTLLRRGDRVGVFPTRAAAADHAAQVIAGGKPKAPGYLPLAPDVAARRQRLEAGDPTTWTHGERAKWFLEAVKADREKFDAADARFTRTAKAMYAAEGAYMQYRADHPRSWDQPVPPGEKALDERADALRVRFGKDRDARDDAIHAMTANARAIVLPEHGIDVWPNIQGFGGEYHADIEKAYEAFGRMINRPALNDARVVTGPPEEGRSAGRKSGANAYYSSNDDMVALTDVTDHGVTIHELGHWLEEHDRQVHQVALDFLKRRTEGELIRQLVKIAPDAGYAPTEIACPDRFYSPYVGRIYGDRATEVVSMGVEAMYRNPVAFAKEDPEHFELTYNLMHGGMGP